MENSSPLNPGKRDNMEIITMRVFSNSYEEFAKGYMSRT